MLTMFFSLTETPPADGVVRLIGVGELDMASAVLLEKTTAEVVRRTRANRLVIDLDGVTFLDAAGLSALGACHRDARQCGTDLRIARARGLVQRVLDITGFEEWLTDRRGR